ncbi:MAG TPA: thiamine-phosphate kinase [Methanothrix soehngenii]|jgi:thiamine-monophosphate kinase|uniref:Thiamine-monophosphate kinase n=1 Tax=Methanothrix soehngenii (strain ATCC 5969 / DSM 3671 / JCM 10134 / NBRC 103675 / OCM 69 / GP-6) TaxID=990316 RepID=F4BUA3_METSG|nr:MULTISPECIES: thiamine-phosphate kinase [Methanothrix]AEB69480.1 thiamine-monophosphate kinase [Methanothrix soehngenii GP6]HNY34774.1 thiamine-phosphate kinase [Methanothrix soehngenii]
MNGAIGERDLIRRISVILGGLENDDCAVIDAGERYLVASTDMLHQKTDFPDIMNPWQMGWMAVAVNLSDIAAMGAEPAGVLIAAGLPPEADQYFIDELFSGFGDCAALYGTRILGGDTDSHLELTITGTSLGFVEKELILRRRGARAGDLLCTTGSLGAAGGGLWAWQNGAKSELITSLLEPEPRLKEARALAKSGSVTAMMDNSDGLALSLSDLSEVSGVGFLVYQDKLPLAPGLVEMVGQENAIDMALSAGGDYELVFTLRSSGLEAARRACDLTVIGEVVEEGIWMERAGKRRQIERLGYEHRIGL